MMVYSHVLFLILRAVLYMLPPENFTSSHSQAGWMSLCLSLDAINTVLVYFAPKWYAIVRHKDVRIRMTTARSNRRCPPNHQSPFPRYNGTRDSAVLSTNNGGGRKRSWLSHVGESSRWSSNNNMMDSQKTIDFEEPPPSSDELKLLMGEVFDFLAAAAAIQDDLKRSTLLPQGVSLSIGGQGIGESNGKEHEFQGQIDGKGDKDDDNDSGELPNKDTYFMKKDELLLFRSICRRIGKARFDFESRFHNHMSQPQPQLPLPQQKLLQQQQKQHQEGRGDVGYNAVALLGGGKGSGSPSFLISPRSSSLFMSGRIETCRKLVVFSVSKKQQDSTGSFSEIESDPLPAATTKSEIINELLPSSSGIDGTIPSSNHPSGSNPGDVTSPLEESSKENSPSKGYIEPPRNTILSPNLVLGTSGDGVLANPPTASLPVLVPWPTLQSKSWDTLWQEIQQEQHLQKTKHTLEVLQHQRQQQHHK
jgi:hypothetical protein